MPTQDNSGFLTSLKQKASPGTAALVVIDVQNDFIDDDGFFAALGADVGFIQSNVVPALERLIEAARDAGVPVVFVQAIYDEKYLSDPMRERNLRRNATMQRCIAGTRGAQFYKVAPAPGELVVVKHRYSAVPRTGLLDTLRSRGISSLLLTGVATDTCVESTGRDAYFRDFYVTMVADCCGAFNAEDHVVACRRFDRDYGAVVTSDDVIATWQDTGAGNGNTAGLAAKSLATADR